MSLLSKYVLCISTHFSSPYTSRFPRVRLSSNFQDSHVYVCRRSILDILQEKPYYDSFREDFIPWLCKVQYQKLKRKKYGHSQFSSFFLLVLTYAWFRLALCTETNGSLSQSTALHHSTLLTPNDDLLSLVPDNEGDVSASLKIGVILHRHGTDFAIRVHNLHHFVEANRRVRNTFYQLRSSNPLTHLT